MADEITEAGAGTDVAAPGSEASTTESGEKTTNDSPGFEKESFGEMLNRVTSEKPTNEKTEVEDDTPEPEKAETKKETKAELPPEAPMKEDAEGDDAEPELLSTEEIDTKFSNAPKGLRSYAKAITKQFAPYAEAIDELGGIEAVKRLDKMATVALGVPDLKEGGNLDQFHDYVKSLNPDFLDAYNKKLFYSALDDPQSAEALLNPFIQADERYKDFTFSKFKEIADLVIDGAIDLDEIKERLDTEKPEEAEKRKAAEAKAVVDEAEKADMRRRLDEGDMRAQEEATKKDLTGIWEKYQEKAAPVWKQFGLGKDFINDKDPQEIKDVKQAYLDDLNNAIGRRLQSNPLFQDLAKRLGQKERGDGYGWLVEKCSNIYKGVVREEALKRSGLLSGFLKSYGQPVKETKTRRPESEVDARKAAHGRTTGAEPEERKQGKSLGEFLAEKTA